MLSPTFFFSFDTRDKLFVARGIRFELIKFPNSPEINKTVFKLLCDEAVEESGFKDFPINDLAVCLDKNFKK